MTSFKYCIVTLIFNNYDVLKDPEEVDENCDYFCFTDDKNLKNTSTKWNVIYLEDFDTDLLNGRQKTNLLKFQIYKYIPNLKKYDYIVRIDGSMLLHKSLRPIINYFDKYKYDLGVSIHPTRDNMIDEYRVWFVDKGLPIDIFTSFFTVVRDSSCDCNSLTENGMQIYRNCKEIYNLLDDVYNIIKYYTDGIDLNDQCWFTFVLFNYINKIRVHYLPAELYRESKYISLCSHGSIGKLYTVAFPYKNNTSGKTLKFLGKYITVTNIKDYEQ